ncbi:MAG: TolC family outer membrane protein [Pirellulaceae bacterium]
MSYRRFSVSSRFSVAARGTAALGLCAFMGVSVASMDVAQAMSLEEAVKMSLSNPDVGEAKANRRAVDQDLREARGLHFPTVDMRADTGPSQINNSTTRAIDSDDDWLWRRQASLIVVQKIFDGGNVSNQVDRQRARVSAAAARVTERSEFIGLDAVQAYLDVLRQIELVRLAEENLRANVSKFEDVRSRVRAGRSSIADQRQSENRVSQARNELVGAQRRLDEARAQYLRVVGAEPTALSRPALSTGSLPVDVGAALEKAQRKNPSIIAASREVEAADALIRVNEAAWWPQVNLEMTATRGADVGGLRGANDEYLALLVARWNLYSGGSDTARRSGSMERAIEARERLHASVLKSDEETRRSWIAMTRQRQQVGILRERVTSAEGVLDAYGQQFNVGQRDILDVLDAQNDLFNAKSELATAEYSELFASYRLLAVTGDLMAALNIPYPEEARGAGEAMSPSKDKSMKKSEAPSAAAPQKAAVDLNDWTQPR